MRRRLLLITILATTGLASAQGDGRTLTCSVTPRLAGCFVEQVVYSVGNLEAAVGVDAQASWSSARSYLAPYATLAWYADTWSAWLEVALPDSRVPTFGRPDAIRLGFTTRF